jgi:hypothetical protein
MLSSVCKRLQNFRYTDNRELEIVHPYQYKQFMYTRWKCTKMCLLCGLYPQMWLHLNALCPHTVRLVSPRYDRNISEICAGNVVVDTCTLVSDDLIWMFVEIQNLTALNFFYCVYLRDRHLIMLTYGKNKVTQLNVSKCSSITDRGLGIFLSHNVSLEVLIARDCVLLNGKCIRELSNSLRHLDIGGYGMIVDNSLLEHISTHYTKLHTLDFTGFVDNVGLIHLHSMDMLRTLRIRRAEMKEFKLWPKNLQSLTLDDCRHTSSLVFPNALLYLSINHYGKVNLGSIFAVIDLQRLTLSNISNLNNYFLIQCSKRLKKIKYIKLINCDSITDIGIYSLFKIATLKHVSLEHCSLVTPMLYELVRKNFPCKILELF